MQQYEILTIGCSICYNNIEKWQISFDTSWGIHKITNSVTWFTFAPLAAFAVFIDYEVSIRERSVKEDEDKWW